MPRGFYCSVVMIIFIYFKNVFFFFHFQEKALTVFRLAYEKAVDVRTDYHTVSYLTK